MRDKFSKWNKVILDYCFYDNNLKYEEDEDNLSLTCHLNHILKDDCTHMEDREIEEDNLLNYNKDVDVQHTRFFNVLFFLSFESSKQIGISWKDMNFMINLFLINFYILHHMGIKIQISEIGEK